MRRWESAKVRGAGDERLRAGAETALGEAEGKRRDEESNEGKGVKVGTWEGEERLKDDEPEVGGQTSQNGKPSYRITPLTSVRG